MDKKKDKDHNQLEHMVSSILPSPRSSLVLIMEEQIMKTTFLSPNPEGLRFFILTIVPRAKTSRCYSFKISFPRSSKYNIFALFYCNHLTVEINCAFRSIASRVMALVPRVQQHVFLPANHSSSFFLSPVNSVQVELALSGLYRHKATIDIPNYLIKLPAICFPLPSQTYLMNQLNQVLSWMSSRSPK